MKGGNIMNTNYKVIRVAVKGSRIFDQYAINGHDNNYYSTWQVRVKLHNGQIAKVLQCKLLETYATPTQRQLDNAQKLFNNSL
jgi:hypothetical protein